METMSERRSAAAAAWTSALATIVVGALAVACAWFFVRTERGQVLDELALRGSFIGAWRLNSHASALLELVSVPAVAVGMVVVGIIGLLRRRWRDAVAAVVTVAGANVTTRVVKYDLLSRPDLLGQYSPGNSLPSGHTTVAASLVVGMILVSGRLLREIVAVVGGVAVVAFGYATLVNHWHRPSDVVAAVLVTGAWGLAAITVVRVANLARGAPDDGVRPSGTAVVLLLGGVAALAVTAVLTASVAHVGLESPDRSQVFAAYAAGAAALAGVTGCCLGLLVLLAPRTRALPAF